MIEWTRNDQNAAYYQGWGVFETDMGTEIQRLDYPAGTFVLEEGGWLSPDHWTGNAAFDPIFESDTEALAFVGMKARDGDELAQKALAFVKQDNERLENEG